MGNHTSDVAIETRLNERLRPNAPPVMYQRWDELLFLHWAVDPERVQSQLPDGLTVDTFDGVAWIGVVPFQMRKVRPRFLPALPVFSNFPELNLRTYVVDSLGRPGVWFYSLDTPQPVANWIARRFFHLNYRLARFEIERSAGLLRYDASLRLREGWDETQRYSWTRQGEPYQAEPGTREFFLVERYRLFAYDRKRDRLFTGRVHHAPYPVQQVELIDDSKRLFRLNQLKEPESAPSSILASAGVDVTIYPLRRMK